MEHEDKISQLERTILELGSEVFRIKTEMYSLKSNQENFCEVMKGLKNILDEKGLISSEDFDGAVDLGQALAASANTIHDTQYEDEVVKIKKVSH